MAAIVISSVINIAENPNAGAVVAILDIDDKADGETFTFELANDFSDRFEIVGNELRVKTASLFDFEAALTSFQLAITATSTDTTTPTDVDSATVTVNVTNVNEFSPTDLIVTGGTVAENSPVNAPVAALSAVDQDRGETFTYSLVDAGGAAYSDPYFMIDGNTIRLKAGLDDAQVGTHTLHVKVTDSGGLSYVEQVTITVTNSAEIVTGRNKNDNMLYGGADDDIINGLGGNDKLYGFAGNDTLNGGTGKDILFGGDGADTFVFDAPFKKGHFDQVRDFKSGEDKILFDLDALLKTFKVKASKGNLLDLAKKGKPDKKSLVGLDKVFKEGKLEKKFFTVGTTSKDGNDYVVYSKKSGTVYLDGDGSGNAKPVEILKLKPGTTLSFSDFLFI
jgi:Ca2+-binding RTX toxin-like protein